VWGWGFSSVEERMLAWQMQGPVLKNKKKGKNIVHSVCYIFD
jgi:hypothetical protein